MAAILGVANAFWIAGWLFAKSDAAISWSWFWVITTAFASFSVIAAGCLAAHLYDEQTRY